MWDVCGLFRIIGPRTPVSIKKGPPCDMSKDTILAMDLRTVKKFILETLRS